MAIQYVVVLTRRGKQSGGLAQAVTSRGPLRMALYALNDPAKGAAYETGEVMYAIVVYKISHDRILSCEVPESGVAVCKRTAREAGMPVIAVVRPKQTWRDA